MTEDYLEERAARGSRKRFEAVLEKVPDVEPEERDRLDWGAALPVTRFRVWTITRTEARSTRARAIRLWLWAAAWS